MRLKSERGQAMVEFALVLPLLLMIVCGVIDFGWYFGHQLMAENAAREAARRCAISDLQQDEVEDIVRGVAPTLDARVEKEPESPAAGESVTIVVESDLDVLTVLTSMIVGDTLPIRAQCTMRIEYTP